MEWRPTHSAVRRGPEARKRSAEEHLLLRDPIDPVSTRIESAETAAAKAPAAFRRPVAAGAPTGLLARAGDGGLEPRLAESLLRVRGAPLSQWSTSGAQKRPYEQRVESATTRSSEQCARCAAAASGANSSWTAWSHRVANSLPHSARRALCGKLFVTG